MANPIADGMPGVGATRARISGQPGGSQTLQLPLPLHVGAYAASRRAAQPPASRLTWSFAFCALLSMGSFFIAHVMLSSWLVSEESLLERGRFSSFRRQQLMNFNKVGGASGSETGGGMKRILVLGSHHTGTSVITKLIIEAGANAGDDLVMLPGNDLKYNEYRPAVEANKRVMSQGHPDIRIGPTWLDYGFSWDKVPVDEQKIHIESVNKIIHDLDMHTVAKQMRSWVLKDPRMTLLADQWVGRSPHAICVLVLRNPIEASIRLAKVYNRGPSQSLNVNEWMEFWTQAMIRAGRTCLRLKRKIVYAFHSELMENPFAFAQKLEKDIFGETKKYLQTSDVTKIIGEAFSSKGKVRDVESADDSVNQLLWLPHVHKTWKAFVNRDLGSLPPPSRMSAIKREAYATIVTGNNKGFVTGALALARSIRQFDSKRDLVAMLSIEVTDDNVRKALTLGGWRIADVKKLEEPWYETHPKCREFTESQRVRWGRMFSKLRVYSLPYQRVMYLDTDVLGLRDPSPYFSSELFPRDFYAERSPSHRGINAGIMLLTPSNDVLDKLITYAKEHEPMQFWSKNQVGCTEQELLNRFWDGANPENKLNNTRHFDYLTHAFLTDPGRDENRQEGARFAHCLTTKCPKPWDVNLNRLIHTKHTFDVRVVPGHCDRLIYLEWYRIFLSKELSDARMTLLVSGDSTGDVSIPALDRTLSYKEASDEVAHVAGRDRINFRTAWNAFDPELNKPAVDLTPNKFAEDLRQRKKSLFSGP